MRNFSASVSDFFERRFDRWLNRNLPAAEEVSLSRKNTFILPTGFGFVYLATCITLFLLGTNYQNNLILFLSFFLSSVFVTSLLLTHRNLAGLRLKACQPEPEFAGELIAFPLKMETQHGQSSFHFEFRHQTETLAPVIADHQALVYLRADKRGLLCPPRLKLSSVYPFGLFKVWTWLDFGWQVVVYPSPLESKLQLSGDEQGDEIEGSRSTAPGFDEFAGLKEWQQGESLKSVAWKQVAQGRGWFSKTFEQARGSEVWLDLSSVTARNLEDKLSQLCWAVLTLDQQKAIYGLKLGQLKIAPAAGDYHKKACLEALALYGRAQTRSQESSHA